MSPFDVRDRGAYWASTFISPGKTVGLKITASDSLNPKTIGVAAFCSSALSAEEMSEVRRLISQCLSASEDIAPFYELARGFPSLKNASRHLRGMRVLHTPDLFASLLLAVCLQRASFGRSKKMLESIFNHYGSRLSFGGRTTVSTPSPSAIINAGADKIKKTCRVGYRADSIVSAADFILRTGIRTVENFFEMPQEQVEATLKTIRGIGPYSVSVISPHPAFPVDSWSGPALAKLLGVEAPDGNVIQALQAFATEKFGVWQRYAYEYLVNDLDHLVKIPGAAGVTRG
jgi:3-methyladenine DNA glycosylase/8-oxoguanine DNA glycosylase